MTQRPRDACSSTVTLSANFRRKGVSPTNHCWCQKTRVIARSCGIKISAVHCLVVIKPACDKQTGGRTDEQNYMYDSQDRASIAASRGKKSDVILVLQEWPRSQHHSSK